MTATFDLAGVSVPAFLYGTAWKEDATERLVVQAVTAGFRGIDTANQRKHYVEAAVGAAIRRLVADGTVGRGDLFLQTKFTFARGQDHRMPYDPASPVVDQVAASFASSKEHLGVDRIDSYVLHGPSGPVALGPADVDAWRAMEHVHDAGGARFLGISNVSLAQLRALCAFAHVRPSFVQNRCYATTGWDHEIRAFCRDEGVVYQGFSLLTANPQVLVSPLVRGLASGLGRTPAQVVFRFAHQIGMLPLTGTSDAAHMQADLDGFGFALDDGDVRRIERIAG